jgi:hypothetical protein
LSVFGWYYAPKVEKALLDSFHMRGHLIFIASTFFHQVDVVKAEYVAIQLRVTHGDLIGRRDLRVNMER